MSYATEGLSGASLMFVFLDVSSLPRHRRLYEEVFGFEVIENQFHPPHEHHGLVKYDAGGTILAVNLFAERKFQRPDADGVTLVCRVAEPDRLEALTEYGVRTGADFTDVDGHHYRFTTEQPAGPGLQAEISELRVAVPDLAAAVPFYRDVLGLRLAGDDSGDEVRFHTGSIDLTIYQAAVGPDGRPLRYNAFLMVFYTGDVEVAERELAGRGLTFSQGAGFSDIGGTARFRDPSGNVFCLYQPSAESLTWGSADKVMQLMTHRAPTRS
ncbi:VOC family protein [Actinoplanes sp. NPDC051859]|uniref:VOC family protein n=1 Tax=Actinoplanes sp. NPDC051859 TaxID=3363909 RepID=UPI0037B844A9